MEVRNQGIIKREQKQENIKAVNEHADNIYRITALVFYKKIIQKI